MVGPVASAHHETESDPGSPDADEDLARIVARPDGFHWLALNGKQEFGPFETLAFALSDMVETNRAAQTLQEAESEIGMADWIDPETGELAEGQCPPHLERE